MANAKANGLEHKMPAVVIASGAMGPAHRGHVHLLACARERLERAGYAVLAGWLSLVGDNSPRLQREGAKVLSLDFRILMAELAVAEDDFASVATWEAQQGEVVPDTKALVSELQKTIMATFGEELGTIRVIYVCGSDEPRRGRVLAPEKGEGCVVVPRPTEDMFLEKPHMLSFVAEPYEGRLAALTSETLWGALKNRDTAYVREFMMPGAARLLLEPTDAERLAHGPSLEQLAGDPEGPFPSHKFLSNVGAFQSGEGKIPAVLIASGTMSPVHRGHILMLRQARERLERAGYAVMAAWIAPCNDGSAQREATAKESPCLSAAFRQRVTELAVCEDDFVACSCHEIAKENEVPLRDRLVEVQSYLSSRYEGSLDFTRVRVFYACGGDSADKYRITKGIASQQEIGCVIVPRSEDEIRLENPNLLVYVADAVQEEAAMLYTSTQLRTLIQAGDVTAAAKMMCPAAARFLLVPTAAERKEFQNDFDQLRVAAPQGGAALTQMRERLRASFRAWIGPKNTIRTEDITKLLQILDPSWNNKELAVLAKEITTAGEGRVTCDDFLDWIFSRCPR